MRRIRLCALLGLACSLVLAAPASSQSPSDVSPPRMNVSSHDVTVEATRGSSCTFRSGPEGSGYGVCGDSGYPLVLQGAVPVHRAGALVLEAEVAVTEISVSLRDAGSRYLARLPVRPLDGTGRRFEVTMPDAPVANRVGVFIRYSTPTEDGGTKRGDADYEAGLTEHRHAGGTDRDDGGSADARLVLRRRGSARPVASRAFRAGGRLVVRTHAGRDGRLLASADLRVTTRKGRARVVALRFQPCRRVRNGIVCRGEPEAAVFAPVGPGVRQRYVARRTLTVGKPDCVRVSVHWTTARHDARRFPGPAWKRRPLKFRSGRRSLTVC